MTNVPRSLRYSSLTLFKQAITADPWPFVFLEMGSQKNFHLHLPHHNNNSNHAKNKQVIRDVPKGCLAIKVGQAGEEQQRFVVPVLYFNHPLFMQLLKEAEEEYGFEQKGTITIPCHVEEFRYVQGMIDREKSIHNNHHGHHHHVIGGCFRV
ncbi:hypothetical protein LWI29_003058 [Acer saccharum]|uniref:Uncharacterized protein n=1 Tax=Acer saccharum TaxID=4024 RepID=A0AA39RUN3_ACESA|nr:hypothetical protein LWI29_003058 [Acer saccharum]